MVKLNDLSNRFRIVFRRSPILLKCAVLVTIVLSVAALTVLRVGINQNHEQTNLLRAQAAQLEQENRKLDNMYQLRDTEAGIRTIAQETLGLVESDTVFYDVVTNQD